MKTIETHNKQESKKVSQEKEPKKLICKDKHELLLSPSAKSVDQATCKQSINFFKFISHSKFDATPTTSWVDKKPEQNKILTKKPVKRLGRREGG